MPPEEIVELLAALFRKIDADGSGNAPDPLRKHADPRTPCIALFRLHLYRRAHRVR
jgi:hypothetical protein